MIQKDKLKVMTQMALYEKKKGREDMDIYRYQREDYIRFQKLKTWIAATAAFLIIGGFLAAWNIEVIINHFDTYDYRKIGLLVLAAYSVFVVFFLSISSSQSKERYNMVRPRIRRYYRNLTRIEEFYKKEDEVREEFEKGEWRDGQ